MKIQRKLNSMNRKVYVIYYTTKPTPDNSYQLADYSSVEDAAKNVFKICDEKDMYFAAFYLDEDRTSFMKSLELRDKSAVTDSNYEFPMPFDGTATEDIKKVACELGIKMNGRYENKREREKVDPETLKLAKEKGVVQMKPNGSWGIISLKSGEWWDVNYQSEESARAALKAYHASRHNSKVTVDPKLWDEAVELVKKINPDETEEDVQKLVSFGFGLAYKPKDFIDTLRESLIDRSSNAIYKNPKLTPIRKEFEDAQDAYEWMEQNATITQDPIATIKIGNKCLDVDYFGDLDTGDEGLRLTMPDGKSQLLYFNDWKGRMGEMFDYINDVCRSENSHKSNSKPLSSEDSIAADKYVKEINDKNFREVCKKLAADIGEKLDLRKVTANTIDEFRDFLATSKEISDRLYAAIDYLLASYLGYVGHVKRNSRTSNSVRNYAIVCDSSTNTIGQVDTKAPGFNEDNFISELRKRAEDKRDGYDKVLGLYETQDEMDKAYDEFLTEGYIECSKVRKNNSRVAGLYKRVKRLAKNGWKCVFDTDEGVIELIRGDNFLTIDSGNENLILSGKDILYVNRNTDKFLEAVERQLK